MDDFEITKLCAKALGAPLMGSNVPLWNPLRDDAQAMALVKKFQIAIAWSWVGQVGCMSRRDAELDENKRHDNIQCTYKDLNRAICECVAKMQKEKP